jgi:hypothetical protein
MADRIFPAFDLVGSIVNELVILNENPERYTTQEFYRVLWYRLVERFPKALIQVDESIAHNYDDYNQFALDYGYEFFNLVMEIVKMYDPKFKKGE